MQRWHYHWGGNTDMPAIQQSAKPLQVQGKVTNLTDGRFRINGPMYHGLEVCMGPTAVLDTGKMQIIVVSRHIEPWDPGLFHSLGIDPEQKRLPASQIPVFITAPALQTWPGTPCCWMVMASLPLTTSYCNFTNCNTPFSHWIRSVHLNPTQRQIVYDRCSMPLPLNHKISTVKGD